MIVILLSVALVPIVELVSSVVILIIVASSVASVTVVVVVHSMLLVVLVRMDLLLTVVVFMFQLLLETLLQLLLVCEARGISELLLLLLHLLSLMLLLLLLLLLLVLLLVCPLVLLSLAVSHAGIVEVVHGGVDVAHVASPLHHHGPGPRTRARGRTSVHHLGLDISQGLHAGHRGRGEGGPRGELLRLRLLGKVWRLLLGLGQVVSRGLGRGHLGQGHDGRVVELAAARTRAHAAGEVGRGQQRELLLLLRLLHELLWRQGLLRRQLVVVYNLLLLLLLRGPGKVLGLLVLGLDREGRRRQPPALQTQLVHPLHHGAVAQLRPAPATILRGRGLQPILQLAPELLAVRPKVEEVLTLFESSPLLLSEHGQLLVSVLLPLVTETSASEGFIVKGVEFVLGTKVILAFTVVRVFVTHYLLFNII